MASNRPWTVGNLACGLRTVQRNAATDGTDFQCGYKGISYFPLTHMLRISHG